LPTVTAARLPRNDWPEKGGEKGASLPIMRGMTLSPLAIQLGIALILVLSIAVSTLSFALRSRKAGAGPTIRATSRKLKPGWYQLQIAVTNQAPDAVIVDELRRVRPRAARLMAPIQQVSTREGDFQVWSDPTTDKARISIPLDIALGPNDTGGGGRVLPAKDAQLTAWLFLPAGAHPSELVLELTLVDGSDHLRAYRFSVAPDPENVSKHDETSRRA
jgi:hypothetical protein